MNQYIAEGKVIAFILLLSSLFLVKPEQSQTISKKILTIFVLLTSEIIVIAKTLSLFNFLANKAAWLSMSLLFLIVSVYIFRKNGKQFFLSSLKSDITIFFCRIREDFGKLHWFERAYSIVVVATFLFITLIDLLIICCSPPNNWDSLAYHLPRMAYYLQHGNLTQFPANYWAQITHPINASIFLVFAFLSSNSENLLQFVQFFSMLMCTLSIYRISDHLKIESLVLKIVTSLLFGLLPTVVFQATTTQNDVVASAFFGGAIAFLLDFIKNNKFADLFLSFLAMSIGLGVKESSILYFASVLPIFMYTIFIKWFELKKNLIKIRVIFPLILFIFTLTSGYLENILNYGHPIGPQAVRSIHMFPSDYSLKQRIVTGLKNALRFGGEFLSLDGLPPTEKVLEISNGIISAYKNFIDILGADLEYSKDSIRAFVFNQGPKSNEDYSYWGVIGFGLLWPAVLFSVLPKKNKKILPLCIGYSAVLFLLIQGLAGPFDPWRGRYFIACAILIVPLVGYQLESNHMWVRIYSGFVIAFGCASAITSLLFGGFKPPFSLNLQIDGYTFSTQSIFKRDRLSVLLQSGSWYDVVKNYEKIVPSGAVVAAWLPQDFWEYPYFGEGINIHLIPVNTKNILLAPEYVVADFLLYVKEYPCEDSVNDFNLGNSLYLKRLTAEPYKICR